MAGCLCSGVNKVAESSCIICTLENEVKGDLEFYLRTGMAIFCVGGRECDSMKATRHLFLSLLLFFLSLIHRLFMSLLFISSLTETQPVVFSFILPVFLSHTSLLTLALSLPPCMHIKYFCPTRWIVC